MADGNGGSVLLVHHRDVSSPIGTTVPYYVADRLSDSHTVHVVCRKRECERDGDSGQDVVFHDVGTGDIPFLSAIAFHLIAVVYAAVLGLVYRYDAVYSFQSCIIQGWIGSRASGARFVVGFQSVPMRQGKSFKSFTGTSDRLADRLEIALLSLYTRVVEVLLERSSAVICLTDGIAEIVEETYDVDLSGAHVLGMGVDVEKFSDHRQPEESVPRNGERTLTYVGSVSNTRGLEHVIEALAAVDHDLTFQIAGEGPDEYVDDLMERADRLNVSEQVEWLGLIPHDDVPRLIATTDLSISPLPDIESYRISFPAKILEYMAGESCIIATDIPPHREFIEDGTTGYLYDGTRDGLVETIERCIENGAERSDLERRARERAERYDWDTVVEEYEAVIFGRDGPRSRAPPAVADENRGQTREIPSK